MSDWERLERDCLASARNGFSPTDADRARILSRVMGVPLNQGSSSAEGRPFDASAGNASTPFSAVLATRVGRVLGIGMLVGAVGGLGYQAGLDRGRKEQASVAPAPPASAPLAEAVHAAPVPPERLSDDELAEPDQVFAPTMTADANVRAKPSASVEGDVPQPVNTSLGEELRMLRRVERALRDQNPRLALALLAELDGTAPNGKLNEERRAALATASCQLEPSRAAEIAADFEGHFRESPYQKRIQAACRTHDSEVP